MSFYRLDPPVEVVRTERETLGPLADLDPDLALWQSIDLTIWPFAGAPTEGTWPKGWIGVDNTSAVWICTVGGSPGTWVSLGGGGGIVGLQPETFGAKGDGYYVNDATLVATVPTLASVNANFGPSSIGADVVLQTPVAQAVSLNGATIGTFVSRPQTVTAVSLSSPGTADVPEITMGSTSGYTAGGGPSSATVVYIQGTGTELDGTFCYVASVIDSTHLTVVAERTDSTTGGIASNFIVDASSVVADFGKPVAPGGNIPSGAFVGSVVTTGTLGFYLVDANGNPLAPTGVVSSVTIGTALTAGNTGTFTNGIQQAITTIVVTDLPAIVTAGDSIVITHSVYAVKAGVTATGTATTTVTGTTIYVLMTIPGHSWNIQGTKVVDIGNGTTNLWAPFVTSITGLGPGPDTVTLAAAPTYSGTDQPAFIAHDDVLAFDAMLSSAVIPATTTATYVVQMRPGAVYGIGPTGIKTPKQSNGLLWWNWNGASVASLGATDLFQQFMPGFNDNPILDMQSLSKVGFTYQTGLVNQVGISGCASMTAGSTTVTFSPPIPYADTAPAQGGLTGFGPSSPVVIGGGETVAGAGKPRPNGLGVGLRSAVDTAPGSVVTDGSGNVTSCTLTDAAITSCTATRIAFGDINTQPIAISYWGARRIQVSNMPPGGSFAFTCTNQDQGYPFVVQRLDLDTPMAGFNYSSIQENYNLACVQDIRVSAGWGHDNYSRGFINCYAYDHCTIDAMIDCAPTSTVSLITFDQELGGLAMVQGRISVRDLYGTAPKIIQNAHYSDITYMIDSRDANGNYQATNSATLNINVFADTTAEHVIRGNLSHGMTISDTCTVRLMGAFIGPTNGTPKRIAPIRITGGSPLISAHGCDLELTGTGSPPGNGTATVLELQGGASPVIDIQGGRVLNGGVVVAGPNASLLSGGNGTYGGLAAAFTGSVLLTGSVRDVQGLSNMVDRSSAGVTVLPSEYSIISATGTYTLPANPPGGSAPNIFEVASGHTATLAATDGSSFTTSSLAGPGRWSATFDPTNGTPGTWRVFPS